MQLIMAQTSSVPSQFPSHQSLAEAFTLQGRVFEKRILNTLPQEIALALINQLFSPDERFAQAYLKYHKTILQEEEQTAYESARADLDNSRQYLLEKYQDECFYSLGFHEDNQYTPVGVYCMRPLLDHFMGDTVHKLIEQNPPLLEKYGADSSQFSMVHSFSALSEYRSLNFLKYFYILVATEALEAGYQHIFFYISDHRLRPIYERFGLEFPDGLKIPNTERIVGSYSLTEPKNLVRIEQGLQELAQVQMTSA